ncbi:MAG: LysE family transporter [Thermodesulfobacteriota bacterium]|nr:LysE family transporter [Thermodesulfobacteriota bacterium]
MESTPFLTVLAFSFAVALTGAMSPGPLLTYTIVKSAGAQHRGYLMGTWIIAGHAAIEAVIIILLLAGFSFILKHTLAVRIIGVAGGFVLIFFGASVIRDVVNKKVTGALATAGSDAPSVTAGDGSLKRRLVDNPVTGGALVSMANPYWWVWWATIGFAFMTEFNVTYENIPGLAAFFIGHEAGDLAWYLVVSALSFWGIRRLNDTVYAWLLSGCGVFMIVFGVYLGASPFLG